MFQTVDWTQPQLGGLLSQVIVKEERQLNAPKPRITVKHVWNPEDLAGRKTTWKEHVRVRRFENTDKMTVRGPTHNRYSRSTMLHERKSDETLQAFDRQQKGNDGLQMRRPGTSAAPSTMSNMTPELYEKLKPTYGANDHYATQTSAGLIGLGAREAPHSQPYFSRSVVTPSLAMASRNSADRVQVEHEFSHLLSSSRSRPTTPGIERFTTQYHQRREKAEIERRTDLFARTPGSAFQRRPGEIPL